MAEKKKKGRRAYLEFFKKDDDGNYVYKGDFYIYEGGAPALRRELFIQTALCAGMLAAFIACGCMSVPGMMDTFYVLLPYLIATMCCVSAVWALCRVWAAGTPIRVYVHDATVKAMPGRTLAAVIFGIGAMIGEVVYLFLEGAGGRIANICILFILLFIGNFCGIWLRKRVLMMPWHK